MADVNCRRTFRLQSYESNSTSTRRQQNANSDGAADARHVHEPPFSCCRHTATQLLEGYHDVALLVPRVDISVGIYDACERVGPINHGLEHTGLSDRPKEEQVCGAYGADSTEYFAARSRRPHQCSDQLAQTGDDEQQPPAGREHRLATIER